MKKLVLTMIVALMVAFGAKAQDEKPAQFSFFYPVGTSGMNSINNSYKYSFNTLWGVNGGVNGFEIGSIANVNRGDVKGGQISGVVNFTTGNSNGGIIGGVANVTLGNMDGGQVAGVVNYSKELEGGQVSVINVAAGNMKGGQVGVINTVAGKADGGQVGVINTVAGEADGGQVGVINVANKAKGLQVGVINVVNEGDSIIPLGVINFVRNGYFALEVSASELMMGHLTYKMGVERLHTLYRVGAGMFNDETIFSYGMGLGSIIPVSGRHSLNVEATCDEIVYDKNWDNNLNLVSSLNLQYQYNINGFLSVKAGPVIRTYVTNQKIDGEFNTINVPYTIFEHTGSNTKTSGWVGVTAGITLSL